MAKRIRRKDRVLLNPELMDMTLTLLDFEEIKNARLVCQHWSKFGWKILRRKSVLNFRDEDNLQNYIHHFKKQEEILPFDCQFHWYEFSEELITTFFLTFGSGLRSLTLKDSNLELDINSQSTLKNLEYLSLRCNQMELPIYSGLILRGKNPTLVIHDAGWLSHFKWLRKYLGRFFQQNSSGLKNLVFTSLFDWVTEEIQMIVDSGIKHLDSLELGGNDLNDECLSILGGGGLTFKKLIISLEHAHTPAILANMLNNSRNTLEYLSLGGPVQISLASIHLKTLKTLEVWNYKGDFSVFGNNNFSKLESLELSDLRFDGRDIDPVDDGIQSQTIKTCSLDIDFRCSVDMVALIEHLSNVFPGLNELYICGKVQETHLSLVTEAFEDLRKCKLVVKKLPIASIMSGLSYYPVRQTFEFDANRNPQTFSDNIFNHPILEWPH